EERVVIGADLGCHALNISAKDRAKQFSTQLHKSGGKLFCTSCNVIIEHKHKSSIDKHFVSAKHVRRAADEGQSRNGHECQFISYQCSQIMHLLIMSMFVGNYLTKLVSIFGLYIKSYGCLLILVKKKIATFRKMPHEIRHFSPQQSQKMPAKSWRD
uniref:CGG triplet repeat-binding protein 1 n=1 Tax=Kryptolebias marmoratus TaxID=37003 RepID=A0A3Q3AQ48_KRYMA